MLILILVCSCSSNDLRTSDYFSDFFSLYVYEKTPGNTPVKIKLHKISSKKGIEIWTDENKTARIKSVIRKTDQNVYTVKIKITALKNTSLFYVQKYSLDDIKHDEAKFFLPGLWYRRNLRSSDGAPSMRKSNFWVFREDRLSIPLTSCFSQEKNQGVYITRTDPIKQDALMPYKSGDCILMNKTDVGGTGFEKNKDGTVALIQTYPFTEAPYTYDSKLRLSPEVKAFQYFRKGESVELEYQVSNLEVTGYDHFVKQTWLNAFNIYNPQEIENNLSAEQIKDSLSNYFIEAFTNNYNLKGYSGVHLRIDQCENREILEVGFIGRVLANAFNALEYGEATGNLKLSEDAREIFISYRDYGFNDSGYFRECIDLQKDWETERFSIRRQSEGICSVIRYLEYLKNQNENDLIWENRIKFLLHKLTKLMNEDHSMPRTFSANNAIIDSTGGSSASFILPLVMAYKYFDDKNYLETAEKVAGYVEKEIINKSDYFSSTLDARCEDKEASLYASVAMYYLSLVKPEEHKYVDLAEKSAYFALSYYYLWDVPFAPGQMLGDIGFKTRGWGNVSVENNHVDAFIFEFHDVLKWLVQKKKTEEFDKMAAVIKSSMFQLLPYSNHMCGIAKKGYYPEVVQHTNWDYGKNGKGYYNDYFAPGWVIASLWELLVPNRTETLITGTSISN